MESSEIIINIAPLQVKSQHGSPSDIVDDEEPYDNAIEKPTTNIGNQPRLPTTAITAEPPKRHKSFKFRTRHVHFNEHVEIFESPRKFGTFRTIQPSSSKRTSWKWLQNLWQFNVQPGTVESSIQLKSARFSSIQLKVKINQSCSETDRTTAKRRRGETGGVRAPFFCLGGGAGRLSTGSAIMKIKLVRTEAKKPSAKRGNRNNNKNCLFSVSFRRIDTPSFRSPSYTPAGLADPHDRVVQKESEREI